MTLDEAVATAIREYEEWHRTALPNQATVQPRVMVTDGGKPVLRRPEKIGGDWWVRSAGRGRLFNPRRDESGLLLFSIYYGRGDLPHV